MKNRKFRIETLEERALLAVVAGGVEQVAEFAAPTEAATWVVNTLDDPTSWDTADDVVSLREAIGSAVDGDTIIFDGSLAGGTITLNGSGLDIVKGITIDATSIGGITIDANHESLVVYAKGGNATSPIELISLNITGGSESGISCASWSTVKVTNSTITGNSTGARGGGIYTTLGSLVVTNTTISGNSADRGGGLCNTGSSVRIVNSLIYGNSANYGGGIYDDDYYSYLGELTVTNSVISGNSANNTAGAIYIASGATMNLNNTIVSINLAGYENNIYPNKPFAGSNNIIGLDPGFVTAPVFEAGMLVNIDDINLSLVSSSYAIDRGTNDCIDTESDLSGNPRFFAAWKDTDTVDIGAYEYQEKVEKSYVETASTIVTTNLDILDDTDGLISLREAISYAGESDIVTFDTSLEGKTIVLGGGALLIDKSLTIDASGIGEITIDGNAKSAVFYVANAFKSIDVELINLSIKNARAGYGGGIYNDENLTFVNSSISECMANFGAGFYNTGTLTVTGCVISGNISREHGGGFYNNGTLTVLNSTINGNKTTDRYRDGGGIYNNGTLSVTNTSINRNSSSSGSGIYNNGSTNLINSLIYKNSAGWGGGIYNNSKLTSINCTVSDNTATYSGHDINNNQGFLNLRNTISLSIYNGSGLTYAYNSLSSYTAWTESDNSMVYNSSSPLFTDSSNDDYTLADYSQAINAGNNDYVITETDLAGNPRILNGTVDLGAYEYTGQIEPLDAPTILTGSRGYYVSYGANRHQVEWSAVDRAAAYEFAYSEDGGNTWTTLETNDTSAVVRGLAYGEEVSYRVRALSTRYLKNSEWSAKKTFNVCPMDINNDGDISGPDRSLMATAWGREIGEEKYRFYADINGDGDISGPDRNILGTNWGYEADDPNLLYPRPVAAFDVVFAEFESADIDFDADAF